MAERRDGRRDARRATPPPRPGSSTRAATTGAKAVELDAARARVPRRAPGPLAGDVLRRRADARLAGARARRRSRPAAARRADQPPRHRVAGVARDAPAVARRRRRAGRARSLVPRGGRHLRARARGRAREVLQGHLARLAARRRRSASWRSAARSRSSRPRSPSSSASSPASARARAPRQAPSRAEEARQDRAARARPAGRQGARLRLQAAGALRPRRLRGRGRRCCEIGDRVLLHDAELWLERGEHVSLVGANGSGKTTLITALDGRARARRRQAAARAQRQARAARAARRGAGLDRHGAGGLPARDEAHAEQRALAARAVPVQRRGGREAAGRAVAAASGSGCRWRSSSTPARTS